MQTPSGEFLDQANDDLVHWVCTQALLWYQMTPQLQPEGKSEFESYFSFMTYILQLLSLYVFHLHLWLGKRKILGEKL